MNFIIKRNICLIILILVLSINKTKAQEIIIDYDSIHDYVLDADNKDTLIFIMTVMPDFPGVDEALNNYIKTNLKYPENPKLEGFLIFILNKDSKVEKILIRSSGSIDLDDKRIKMLSKRKRMKFKNKGKPFKVLWMDAYRIKLEK